VTISSYCTVTVTVVESSTELELPLTVTVKLLALTGLTAALVVFPPQDVPPTIIAARTQAPRTARPRFR